MAKALDFIRMVQRGDAAPPPIADLIGFTLREVDPGRAVVAFEAGPRHANPMGTLHGGVLCDIADAAMGMARGSRAAWFWRFVPRALPRSRNCLAGGVTAFRLPAE